VLGGAAISKQAPYLSGDSCRGRFACCHSISYCAAGALVLRVLS
jgi:hypothetical protein